MGNRSRDKEEANGVELVRPFFRPRVILKFYDWVDIPYEDGAEHSIVEKYGFYVWTKLVETYSNLTLSRLITVVPPAKIQNLVEEAMQLDDSYSPAQFFTWYVIDTPSQLSSQTFADILLESELVEKAYPDGQPADPSTVSPVDDTRWQVQGYLDPAPTGIDAEYAWTVLGGDGTGQRFIDLEQGWTLDHEDLVDNGAKLLFGKLYDGSRKHGTAVLGEICASDNALGCIGIVPNIDSVDVVSHSGSFSNVSDAIIAAIITMEFGHVLLLEMQTTPWSGANLFGAPVELIDHIFDAIRLATALGIVVVEAAGNGNNDLSIIQSVAGLEVLNPASSDFRDSGAVIVGAGSSTVPHYRMKFSSYGARVDCYAWGENVATCSSDKSGSKTIYTGSFSGTSSASPIVAGAAIAIQGIFQASLGYRLSPGQIRKVLREPLTGTPSAQPHRDLIGVMPDLAAIIKHILKLGPADLYMRDHVGDTGDPHSGAISSSPDLIVQPTAVANPSKAYGEGSGTENSATLGYKVEEGQDNFIYARIRNRGTATANNVEVNVYWSQPATLVTPDLWNHIGSTTIPVVPVGDILTVSDAIVWPSANVPATGHYSFVATVGTVDDPVPPMAALMDFDKFRAFIRNNNGVTRRTFNVIDIIPDPAVQGYSMDGLIVGAPDRSVEMGLEVDARLPKGASLTLEAPLYLLLQLGFSLGQVKKNGVYGRVRLIPHGSHPLGVMPFPAELREDIRLIASLPEQVGEATGYQVALRQFIAESNEEVGRITWYLAGNAFFERRTMFEKSFFVK